MLLLDCGLLYMYLQLQKHVNALLEFRLFSQLYENTIVIFERFPLKKKSRSTRVSARLNQKN